MNNSHLAGAIVSAASALAPIVGYGDTSTRGPANASVYVYASSTPGVPASAR